MKIFAAYALTAAVIIAAVAAAASAFAGLMGRRAVLVSAALALAVQLVAFAIARRFRTREKMMLGWGLGSMLRFGALVLYGLVVARLWRAPVAPALLSFVAFLFVTTIVEPVFLTR
jgi:hypothetical protein